MELFVFQFQPDCNFGKLINFFTWHCQETRVKLMGIKTQIAVANIRLMERNYVSNLGAKNIMDGI